MKPANLLFGVILIALLICDFHGVSHGQHHVPAGASNPVRPKRIEREDTPENRRDALVRQVPIPVWFHEFDADGDGQISMFEWRTAGADLATFKTYDLNQDGFVTQDEFVERSLHKLHIPLRRGQATFQGNITETQERYRDKISYLIVTVDLEAGKAYHIDQISKEYQSFFFVEDAYGSPLAQASSQLVGENCHLVYRPEKTGKYRIVCTSAAGVRVGPFQLTIRLDSRFLMLPAWFRNLDVDEDEQVSLFEWHEGGRRLEEFQLADLNVDGFVTAEEFEAADKEKRKLKFTTDRIEYEGNVSETAERYRDKTSYTFLTIDLEAGQVYQFEQVSPVFQSSFIIEDDRRNVVAESSSRNVGGNCRHSFRAPKSTTYRIVCTSAAGVRTGNFQLRIRAQGNATDLPSAFQDYDADCDGQISLFEWRTAKKKLEEFASLDLNNDGFLTPSELNVTLKPLPDIKFNRGQATYNGALQSNEGAEYRGKISYKILRLELEAGKTYHLVQQSKEFQSFIFLENAEGEAIMEESSSSIGEICKLTYRCTKSGLYRIVATSLGGYRIGSFTLAIQAEAREGELPSLYKDLDTDNDGQISLYEWRTKNLDLNSFAIFDLNNDGFITPEEIRRLSLKK